MQQCSICNVKGSEKFSWYLPVHLIPGAPGNNHTDHVKAYAISPMCVKQTLMYVKGILLMVCSSFIENRSTFQRATDLN